MFNLDRKATRVRVFELGSTFLRNPAVQNTDTTVAGFEQTQRVAGLAYGAVAPLQWGSKERTSDFYDAKADVEALLAPAQAQFLPAEHPAMHPGRCARVLLNGQEIGFVGELHPRWRQHYGMAQAPVLFELDLAPVLQRSVPVFSMVAKHQSVERDLAVIVPEAVTSAQVLAAVHSGEAEDWLRAAVLFDVYRPAPTKLDAGMPAPAASATGIAVGEKSLALRLTLNAGEQALSEAHIDAAVAAVLARLVALTGARLRT